MTYEELVEKARQTYGRADASSIEGHLAYQFNITGEAEGAFYLEINDGQIKIEPYEYYDRDVLFTMTAETLIKLGTGVIDPVWAYTTGKLKVQGSLDKALLLKKLSVPDAEESVEEAAPADDTDDAKENTGTAEENEGEVAEEAVLEAADDSAAEEAVPEADKPVAGEAVPETDEPATEETAANASAPKADHSKSRNGKWKNGKGKKKR